MHILNRYILKQFIRPFFSALFAFIGILLVTNVFEQLKTLLKNKVSFLDAFQYFLCIIPSISVQVTPVAALLGVTFCLNQLNKHRELMIMKAVGLNVRRIISPLLCSSLIISFGVLALDEMLVPAYTQKANVIRLTKIENRSVKSMFEHISFKHGNRFFYIKVYNSQAREMDTLQVIEQRLDKTVSCRIDASRGKWNKYNNEYEWTLFDGIKRYFTPLGEVQNIEKFQELKLVLKYSPEDFKEMSSEEMNFSSLFKYITSLKESGYYPRDMLVDFYQKISFPFATFFITLAGIPFALRSKRSGMATGFGMSVVIAFVYWVSMSLGLAWGKASALPPPIAPFLPNIICFMIGTYLLQKTHT